MDVVERNEFLNEKEGKDNQEGVKDRVLEGIIIQELG